MPGTQTKALGRLVTGRAESMFMHDLDRNWAALEEAFAGKRILVTGGAGSIGAATVKFMLGLAPGAVLVVDPAENNLVELLREIRSSRDLARAEVAIEPVDYGSPVMERILRNPEPFDLVLNFAASKHVRSERDVPSLLQMLDTNLLKADHFLGWLRRYGHGRRGVFFVSSDKAANPANLMGASKRIMELMLFWHGSEPARGRSLLGAPSGEPLPRCTSARFANVAFSDGSLLQGFLQRIAKGQPLAGPSNIRRFFVTLEEAGHVCALAAALPAAGEILVPRLSPVRDLQDFRTIAQRVLRHHGLEPLWLPSAEAALACRPEPGQWPCCFLEQEAMGEKEWEEFVGEGERARSAGLEGLQVVVPGPGPAEEMLAGFLRTLDRWREDPALPVAKADIVRAMGRVVPTLRHHAAGRSLDARM